MKKSNLLMLAAVALTTLLVLPSAAKAAVFVDGDIVLGFRATGGAGQTTNYIINLGQASNFLTGGSNATGSVISLGNFGTDLTNTYGASWNSRSDLNFAAVGAVGTGIGTAAVFDLTNTMYLSRNEATFGVQATAWPRGTNTTQGGRIGANITAIGNGFNSANSLASGNNSNAVFEDTTLNYSPGTAWQAKMPSFGGNYNSLESTFANGAASTALDLFRLTPTNQAPGQIYVGRFTFANDGTLSFQSSAVPEPSTYALLVLGGLALVGLKRLHKKAQA